MLVILCGKSGSGKTALTNHLVKFCGWQKIVTYTTRERRPTEIDRYDYNFISEFKFKLLRFFGFFMETRKYVLANGKTVYYGSPKWKIKNCKSEDKKIIILTPRGYKAFLSKNYGINYKCVYLHVDHDILAGRLERRGSEDISEVARRLFQDDLDFDGFREADGIIVLENNGDKTFDYLAKQICSLT